MSPDDVPTTPAPGSPAAAAGQLLGASSSSAPATKKYPSPTQFSNHPWAKDINTMLDLVDKPGENALFVDPATKFKVGECAMATAATFTATDVQIHPGWLLVMSLAAYATVVVVHRLDRKDDEKKAEPAEGNRFASRT